MRSFLIPSQRILNQCKREKSRLFLQNKIEKENKERELQKKTFNLEKDIARNYMTKKQNMLYLDSEHIITIQLKQQANAGNILSIKKKMKWQHHQSMAVRFLTTFIKPFIHPIVCPV